MKLIPEMDFPELQRNPASGMWYVRKFVTGKGEICRSTKEKRSKSKAKTAALKILTEFMGSAQKGYVYLFSDIAEEVLRLKALKSFKTRESARIHIKNHLLPFFGGMRIDQINEGTWEQYILHSQLKKLGRKLFNDRKHMVMVMKHAFKKGLLSRPLEFRNPDPKVEAGKIYESGALSSLLQNAKPDMRLQILMASTMGMRRSEILLLSWERVDLVKEIIHLRASDTKIRRSRSIAINPDVMEILKDRSKDSPWVFPHREDKSKPCKSHKTSWGSCKRLAKVEGRFHDLRHTFLSNMLLVHKVNPVHLSVYAGVSLEVIQQVYLHPSVEDTRSVASMIRGIHMVGENRGDC